MCTRQGSDNLQMLCSNNNWNTVIFAACKMFLLSTGSFSNIFIPMGHIHTPNLFSTLFIQLLRKRDIEEK